MAHAEPRTSVVVAGAGPVGLTLATDLAQRGIDVLVIEPRARLAPPDVKCNHVAARSMEVFRRLGVASAIRVAGLPDDYPHDIAYRVSATGRELTRIPIPCWRDRYTELSGPDANWPTAEPPHRINQLYLEPILFRHAEAQPGLTIRNRARIVEFTQDDEGVRVQIQDEDDGSLSWVRCDYLAGCDGGRSTVRRAIGAQLQGDAVIQRVQSSLIRAPGLLARFQHAPAWATFSLNRERSGNMYAIDGQELWLIHNYLRDDEADFDAVDRDACIRAILGVEDDFDYTLVSKEDWFGRRLVADRFRRDRVFLCGDAAHLWVPYAGYGMNAGIADAANLAWLLAARLQGWGAPAILDAYERERQPITEQVSFFVMRHAEAMAGQRSSVPPEINDDTTAGEVARAALGQEAYDLNVQQYCCAGLNFGYFYDNSPLLAYDGAEAPAYTMGGYTPSTVPGCRAPFLRLDDGAPLFDQLGPAYTLLRFDLHLDVTALVRAFAAQGVPLRVLEVASRDPAREHYADAPLCLVRSDQHIAWRGQQAPDDAAALVAQLRGAA